MTEITLTPSRPYLIRAIYEWLCDNQLTPYLLVDATQKFVKVPQQFVKDGQIVLNIAPHATGNFLIENDAIHFNARFSGVSQHIYIPMSAAMAIYSRENNQGMFFDPQEYDAVPQTETEDALPDSDVKDVKSKTKSKLRIVE